MPRLSQYWAAAGRGRSADNPHRCGDPGGAPCAPASTRAARVAGQTVAARRCRDAHAAVGVRALIRFSKSDACQQSATLISPDGTRGTSRSPIFRCVAELSGLGQDRRERQLRAPKSATARSIRP